MPAHLYPVVLGVSPAHRLSVSLLLVCLLSAFTGPALSAEAPPQTQVTAEQLLTRVAERARQEKSKPPGREFIRTKTTLELDKNNKVEKREELTYRMVIIDGALYPRLIRKNGRPLDPAEQKKEKEKEATFRTERHKDSDKQEKEGNTVLLKLSEEDAKRFDFSVAGRELVNGRAAYVVTVTPKPNLPAATTEHRVMSRISGRLWIDEGESEIAKLEVRLLKPLHFGLGVLAALNSFDFSVHRNRLPDGEWENSVVKLALNFRVLLETTRLQYEEKVSPLPAGDP
jgi:hypothetical protein